LDRVIKIKRRSEMNRIIKLIVAASCIFSLIAFPVACGGDNATEHQAPEKREEVMHEVEPEAKPEVMPEVAPEAESEVAPEAEPEVKY
jgi:hypothetical protein